MDFHETVAETPAAKVQVNWLDILTSRAGFMLVLARFLTDPVIYFVMFWLPAYLEKERGFSLKMIGNLVWIHPGRWRDRLHFRRLCCSGQLMRRDGKLGRSRKMAMSLGAALLPMAIFAPLAPTAGLAIAAMCVVVLGQTAIWVT